MLSYVWVETIFLISMLVRVKPAGWKSCLFWLSGGVGWVAFSFILPPQKIDSYWRSLSYYIFHSREWELRDEVSKCFHKKSDAEKLKSNWLHWDLGKFPIITAARKQLLISQRSVLEVSDLFRIASWHLHLTLWFGHLIVKAPSEASSLDAEL